MYTAQKEFGRCPFAELTDHAMLAFSLVVFIFEHAVPVVGTA